MGRLLEFLGDVDRVAIKVTCNVGCSTGQGAVRRNSGWHPDERKEGEMKRQEEHVRKIRSGTSSARGTRALHA